MGDPSHKKEGHREITTHVSVHTLHLDGLRELYRHFLRLPDGAIVEVKLKFRLLLLCVVLRYMVPVGVTLWSVHTFGRGWHMTTVQTLP